ncbi:Crp/Fnr family transcriptional regulator [Paracoccus acridae]
MVTTLDLIVGCHPQASCLACRTRDHSICAYCRPEELRQIEAMRFFRSFEPRQTIVMDGEVPDFVGTVLTGTVSLTKIMPDGRIQMVAMLRPGNFLGHPYRAKSSYNAVASTSVVMCGFRRKPFERLLRKIPELGQGLLEQSSNELDAARDWMLLLGRKTAREKVASFLIIFAREKVTQDPSLMKKQIYLDLPYTRAEIGDFLGLSLETVSRQFSAFKDDSVVDPDGKRGVTVVDYPALLAETGNDADGGWLA